MQTIWAVPPGIALTDSDSTVITGLTTKYKNTLAQPIPEYLVLLSYGSVSKFLNKKI